MFHNCFGVEATALWGIDNSHTRLVEESTIHGQDVLEQVSVKATIKILNVARKFINIWLEISHVELLMREPSEQAMQSKLDKLYKDPRAEWSEF